MKILITGGAGFIGQHLTHALLNQGVNVRVFDNFSQQVHVNDSLPESLRGKVDLIKGDVRDRDAMKDALDGIDSVVHLAAETGTGQSMYEIDRYFSVNVQGTAILLDLLQNDACGRQVCSIVLASSRALYGEGAYQCVTHGSVYPSQRLRKKMSVGEFEPTCPDCEAQLSLLPTPEQAPFKPTSIYGLTKQVQEQAILMYAHTKGINGFGLRYQNVYGPGQSLKNPYTGILAVFSNLARQGQLIEVYEDGEESRDFIFIDDVIEATLRCINFPSNFVGALNVGSGYATSVMAVAREIKKFFNSEGIIKITGAFRMGDIRHNLADTSSAKKLLDFAAQVQFKEGLSHFLRWVSEQSLEDKSAYTRSLKELAAKGLMEKSRIKNK